MMEEKIKVEQQDFEQIKANPNQTADPPTQQVFNRTTARLFDAPNTTTTAKKNIVDINAEAALMEAILSHK